MPAHSKLTKDVEEKLIRLARQNLNASRISVELNVSKETVRSWCKKLQIQLTKRQSPEGKEKQDKFIFICKKAIQNNETIKLNEVIRKIEYHPDLASRTIKKYNLQKAIRSKEQAILEDKTLNLEEAQSRLPNNTDVVLNFSNGKYNIQTKDGFTYRKASPKLYQGDPRGKCGSIKTLDDIKASLRELKYTYHSNYTNTHKSFTAIHDICGKKRIARLSNFKEQQCPSCSNTGTSKAEEELREWVESLGVDTEKFRFKGKTKGKEIDIYIPSLNLGIEYCGLYWHNELSPQPRSRKYHYDKMKLANNQGIRLITIFEDDWLERKEQTKGFLQSIVGNAERRFFARKCTIKEVDKKEARTYLNLYHIQGKTTSKIALGLYYNDELLGLVTGNCHHRQKGNNPPFVLNRLVFKKGCLIVGGASKLLKHLINYARNEGYDKLISWSDNRWSEGNVYEKTGFSLTEELPPDYSYVINGTCARQSKQSNKKKLLLKKGAIGSMDNTERELALTLGLYRIWDCGKKRWEISL